MRQRIADGIMKWLQDEAPSSFKVCMTANDVRNLAQTICNQFGAEDFDRVDKSLFGSGEERNH